MNVFGIIIINTIFNYIVYKCYNYHQSQEKDHQIQNLLKKIDNLEDQLLKKNEFIARELENEMNYETIEIDDLQIENEIEEPLDK